MDNAVDLTHPAEIAALTSAITTLLPAPPALIVIDTLAPCFGDLDENSTRDMTRVTRHLHQLRQAFGCSVLVVHHTGKAGGAERGAAVLRAACATMLELTNSDGLLTLRFDKMRHGEQVLPRHFRLVTIALGTADDGTPLTGAVPLPASKVDMRDAPLSPRQLDVLDAFRLETLDPEGVHFSDLVDATEIAKSTMNGALLALIRRGLVEKGPAPRAGAGAVSLERVRAFGAGGAGRAGDACADPDDPHRTAPELGRLGSGSNAASVWWQFGGRFACGCDVRRQFGGSSERYRTHWFCSFGSAPLSKGGTRTERRNRSRSAQHCGSNSNA
ncbi:MAG: AAA family ATPase [Chloroflexaceae bacterium]|nr:AAA family ATPase [Chloroflexaceae bacterium]